MNKFPSEHVFFECSSGRLYCADVSILKKFPDSSIDMVITSPPYNIGMPYDKWDDSLPYEKYIEWCKEWIKEIYRILKPRGRFCLNHYFSMGNANERVTPLMDINWIATKEIGFKHKAVVFWEDITISKPTAWGSWLSPASPYINSPYEGILILYKEEWKKEKSCKCLVRKEDFIELCRGVLKVAPARRNIHPCPFPEKLPRILISVLSCEEDIILDPFVGIGTTCIVARNLGRKWIGIDNSEKYLRKAVKLLGQGILL